MKQPFAVLGIFFLTFIIRFISTAGQLPTVSHIHAETILFCLGGLNVEECCHMSHQFSFFSVIYHNQMQTVSNKAGLFCRVKHLCHFFENSDDFLVSIDSCFSIILSLFHILTDHADHPDNPHDMVYMFMCHKDLAHIFPIKTCLFQLTKQCISTTTIDKKMFIPILQNKTCVIALRNHCISCSKHCYIHRKVPPLQV